MVKLRVTVTQDDIDWGRPGEGKACPFALAMNRSLRDVFGIGWHANVYGSEILIVSPTNEITYIDQCDDVADFIWRFDANSLVHPFSVELEVPINVPATIVTAE